MVRCASRPGDGAIWVGHLRPTAPGSARLKLPATTVLEGLVDDVPEAPDDPGYREITYHREGAVGVVSFDFYNGAMSTQQCRRLERALEHATGQDTRVLLLRGGSTFSNGIHLGVIEAAAEPAVEAWDNIVAIDDVCRQIITCHRQLVVCSVAGNAGAGGVMLALGADRVVMREGVVLNPHYRTMGLYGSEYWTYVLPRRVGADQAQALTTRCEPIGTAQALRLGVADEIVRAHPRQLRGRRDALLPHASPTPRTACASWTGSGPGPPPTSAAVRCRTTAKRSSTACGATSSTTRTDSPRSDVPSS